MNNILMYISDMFMIISLYSKAGRIGYINITRKIVEKGPENKGYL